jgi:hypothetical protein
MGRQPHRDARRAKRRTTLTLPAAALTAGLQLGAEVRRGEQALRAYEQAFAGFSEEELMVLDGIALEPLPAK